MSTGGTRGSALAGAAELVPVINANMATPLGTPQAAALGGMSRLFSDLKAAIRASDQLVMNQLLIGMRTAADRVVSGFGRS